MANRINLFYPVFSLVIIMNKLFHVLNIVFFTIGFTIFVFGCPLVVSAAGTETLVITGVDVNAYVPNKFTVTLPAGYNYCVGISKYSSDNWYHVGIYIDGDFSSNISYIKHFRNSTSSTTASRERFSNGISYYLLDICGGPLSSSPYSVIVSYDTIGDANRLYSQSAFQQVRDYFDTPVYEDIEDATLDITGLSCYILNDQTASLDLKESLRNTFYAFTQYYFNVLTDGVFSDSFLPPIIDDSVFTGVLVNYVPGVALSWVSPSLDPDITFNVWVDGKSTVNYKTSIVPIDNFVSDLKPATSVSYAKLKINESPLTQSANSFYQYNTNQGFETILNYIETNGQISPPSTPWQRYSYIGLDTKISRVYIQASKIIDGDNHVGALSYVDIVDGLPSVHEGVTSIDDITASDPDTGTGNSVGTPYNVSGDTIYMGDTINNGDTYNIYGGSGLVVSGGNPLNTVKTLFNAIFKLVQALYLTKLLKWLLIGFTGNPLGDFIL